MKRSSVILVLVTLAAACGGHPETSSETALPTTADTHAPATQSDIGAPTEALANDSDASSMTLETSCAETSSDKTTCGSTSWDFEVKAPANPAYQASCERWVDHATSCGASGLDRTDCATWSKVERPELASVYDCGAAEACDATSTCDEPQPTTFGDDICARVTALSGETCDPDVAAALDANAAWLRDDVVAAGRDCLEALNVDDLQACVQAWAEAVAMP